LGVFSVVPPVFVKRDVTNVVEFIFNFPMPSVDSEQRFRSGFLRSEACNEPSDLR
jgi:hypothetical protein